MATAESEPSVATVASETRGESKTAEVYPLQVEYCGLCTMPPEVKKLLGYKH